jgi:hypothetical protein
MQQSTEVKNEGEEEEEEEEEERSIVPCSPSALRFRPLVPASTVLTFGPSIPSLSSSIDRLSPSAL